jgi:hypothetical protein
MCPTVPEPTKLGFTERPVALSGEYGREVVTFAI